MAHNSAMNAVDPDSGNGEVTIRLPTDCFQIIAGTTTPYWIIIYSSNTICSQLCKHNLFRCNDMHKNEKKKKET